MASGRVSKVKGKVVDIPTVPTIGTATAGAESASVAFTASTKGGPAFTYTALSNPGSVTGTGTTSPVTVTGLTAGTAYTFTVRGNNPTGSSEYSSASNSITALESTSFESIATVSVGSGNSSTITFSSIPSTYTHLQLRAIGRNTATGTGSLDTYMRFNGDTGSNYRAYNQLAGDGSTASAARGGVEALIGPFYHLKDGNTASIYGALILDILDYANTNKNKVTRGISGQDLNGSGHIHFKSGMWMSTAAITSITLTVEGSNSFKQYSHFALYGIKGA
jgi:hypothetical protein